MAKVEKAQLDNIAILNSIRAVSSVDYNNRIPLVTKNNLAEVTTRIMELPTAKNEFIDTLSNMIGKTVFLSKYYDNPFKFFKKGSLPYGKTIQSIFVDIVTGKDFKENFGDSAVSSLIATEKASNIKVEYYSENFRRKYKISVSNSQIRGALQTPNGLSELVQKMIQAPLTGANQDDYLQTKALLGQMDYKEVPLSGYSALVESEKAKKLTRTIKTYVNKFTFLSSEYNKQGVNTFCLPSDVVILVTPDTKAMIDVDLLSSSFNISKAEIEGRLVMIDSFYKKGTTGNVLEDTDCLAIVADEDLVQYWETEDTSESFRNPDTLTTNTFIHKWGIMACCGFVNAIKIKQA